MFLNKSITKFGEYLCLMGRVMSVPERWRMFFKQYVKEMVALGVDSIGIVLLISFFIGAVICIQIKLNIASPWMPAFTTGYTTREIMLLEFSSSIMCLILAGKVGSNIASEIGTMRVTQQIDALEIMGINSASFIILPKILGLVTMIPMLVIFSIVFGFVGAYATALAGVKTVFDACAKTCVGKRFYARFDALLAENAYFVRREVPLTHVLRTGFRTNPLSQTRSRMLLYFPENFFRPANNPRCSVVK